MKVTMILLAVAMTFSQLPTVKAHTESEKPQKVVIYNLSSTPHSFDRFTELTGVEVEVDRGTSIDEIRKDPINSPNPDLVIDADVLDFVALKKAGLLASISSKKIEGSIAPQFRDLSSGWVGFGFRGRALAYNPKFFNPAMDLRYEDLGRPEFQNKLCLRKSTYTYSRALLASMILADGFEETLNVVKAWVQNTRVPIFKGDVYALRALEKGTCGIAFVNSDYFRKYQSKYISDLKLLWPNQKDRGVHVNITGMALLKESKQPELATRFLEFMSEDEEAHLAFSVIKRGFPTNLKYFDKSEAGKAYGRIKWDASSLSKISELDEKAQALAKEAGYMP